MTGGSFFKGLLEESNINAAVTNQALNEISRISADDPNVVLFIMACLSPIDGDNIDVFEVHRVSQGVISPQDSRVKKYFAAIGKEHNAQFWPFKINETNENKDFCEMVKDHLKMSETGASNYSISDTALDYLEKLFKGKDPAMAKEFLNYVISNLNAENENKFEDITIQPEHILGCCQKLKSMVTA